MVFLSSTIISCSINNRYANFRLNTNFNFDGFRFFFTVFEYIQVSFMICNRLRQKVDQVMKKVNPMFGSKVIKLFHLNFSLLYVLEELTVHLFVCVLRDTEPQLTSY